MLLIVSFLAEFVANDKPLVLAYGGDLYWPVLFHYPETTFGGALDSEADYRDPDVRALVTAGDGWAVWPPVPYSYDTIDWQIGQPVPTPPSARHWLGTDDVSRMSSRASSTASGCRSCSVSR